MDGIQLDFERDFEFSPPIVWDALIDPALVGGWLAEARIEPVTGGHYALRWMTRPGAPVVPGRIAELRAPELLQLERDGVGTLRFELTELAGGSRGTSTRLRVSVRASVEPAFTARVTADWMTALDQLDDLLHGHPVDWQHWERDRHESWAGHLDDEANSAGRESSN